jgi:hypothetical protein
LKRAFDNPTAVTLRPPRTRDWHDVPVVLDAAAVRIRHAEPNDAEQLACLLVRNRDYFQLSEPIRGDDYFTAADQRRRIGRAVQDREAGRSELFLIEFEGQLDA